MYKYAESVYLCKTDRARIAYMCAAFLSDENTREFQKICKLLKINKKQKGLVFNPKLFHPPIGGKVKGVFFDFLTKGK